MSKAKGIVLLFISLFILSFSALAAPGGTMVSGKVISVDGEPVDFATVYLKTPIIGQ